jgi:hypothetical protein
MKSIIQFNILHEELGSEAAREGYDLAVGPLVAERRCPHALVVRGKGGLGPFEQLPDLGLPRQRHGPPIRLPSKPSSSRAEKRGSAVTTHGLVHDGSGGTYTPSRAGCGMN